MQSSLATATLVSLSALLQVSCGRTSPDACPVREGLSCDVLAAQRDQVTAQYAAAVAIVDPGLAAAETDLEGQCARAIALEQVERLCIQDRCAELCELHPCAVRGGSDCIARCNDEVARAGIVDGALDDAIVAAAERPGLCACGPVCVGVEALCTELWFCAGAAVE